MSARKRTIFLMTHCNIDLFNRDIFSCLPPFSREKKNVCNNIDRKEKPLK